MSTLPPDASEARIEEEIAFYNVLLGTLDPDADDYDLSKLEHEAVLNNLEDRLHTLRAPAVLDHAQPPGAASRPAFERDLQLPSREHLQQGARPTPSPSLHQHASWNWPSEQSSGTSHGKNTPDSTTPSSVASNLPYKRRRESLQNISMQKKAKSTAHLAVPSTASTPESTDSFDQEDDLLDQKFGPDIATNRAYIMNKMREAEEQRLALIKREREDHEVAKKLATQQSIPAQQAAPAQRATPANQTSNSTMQSHFHSNGQLQKNAPKVAQPSLPGQSSQSLPEPSVKSESYRRLESGVGTHPHGTNSFASGTTGFDFSSNPPRHVPTSSLPIHELKDEDDSSDSDLQVISSEQFARRPAAPPRNEQTSAASNYPSMHSQPWQRTTLSGFQPASQSAYGGPSPANTMPAYGFPSPAINPMAGGTSVYAGYQPAQHNPIGSGLWNTVSDALRPFGEALSNFAGSSAPFGLPIPSLNDRLNDRGLGYMIADPGQTKEDLEKLLENIRPDEEIPPEMRVGSPRELGVGLMEHQKLGLAWLQAQEEGNSKGGILADDMGLGKTIQALALIATRPSQDAACKTTLIIAPVALMAQWNAEIGEKMSQGHKLKVYVMHGQQKKTSFAKLSTFDVVITTFGTVAAEYGRKVRFEERQKADPTARVRSDEQTILISSRSKWHRVIIDEAQMIKNKDAKASLGCLQLNATYRLCMTGTPMMNNVGELFSLIRFLRIAPYNDLTRFNREIKNPIQSSRSSGTIPDSSRDRAMKLLQGILKAILLRRTKKSKVDGNPILNLPERTTEVVHAVMDEEQKAFYTSIETQAALQVNKFLKAGKIGRNYSYILVRLLRLRQACCHPHLIHDFAQDSPGDMTTEEMEGLVNALGSDVVARIKETQGQFECPICYDAVENPTIFFPCGHDCCVECFMKVTDPSAGIEQGVENSGAKCPECRLNIDPKKVFDFKAFKSVYMPDADDEPNMVDAKDEEDVSDDDSDSDSDSDDESDSNSQGDLRDFIVPDDEAITEDETEDETGDEGDVKAEEAKESKDDVKPRGRSSRGAKKSEKKPEKKSKNSAKGKGKGKEKKTAKKKTLADLRKEGLRNASAWKKYLRRLRKNWISSCKVDKTMEILEDLKQTSPGEKVIIFSQFTSFLDLLEVPIGDGGWRYRRYDGSMSAKTRNAAVEDFKDKKQNVTVMLVSLKAGNAGLNLTVASQVIILDPFWNPFIEEQAIDRAHRIGQTRPVKVHRVLIEGTVEDRIIELQERKRETINEALDEKAANSVSRLGRRELRYLFGISNSLEGGD